MSGRALLDSIQELRDRQQTRKASPKAKQASPSHQSAIADDDLRWLLDKDPNPSLSARGAEQLKEDLAAAEEHVSKIRIQYGTMHNLTLRREEKLAELEEELRLQQAANADSRAEIKQAAANVAKHASTSERVATVEGLADEQEEYTLTLNMLAKRLVESKGGHEGRVSRVRAQAEELDARKARQLAANGEMAHAAWQARNGALVQGEVRAGLRNAQSMLGSGRRRLLERTRQAAQEEKGALSERQRQRERVAIDAQAEEDAEVGMRALQAQQAAARLRRLEAHFERVQTLMGQGTTMENVVGRIVEQQLSQQRMLHLREEAIKRHEGLATLKARLDVMREEQVGGGLLGAPARGRTSPAACTHAPLPPRALTGGRRRLGALAPSRRVQPPHRQGRGDECRAAAEAWADGRARQPPHAHARRRRPAHGAPRRLQSRRRQKGRRGGRERRRSGGGGGWRRWRRRRRARRVDSLAD